MDSSSHRNGGGELLLTSHEHGAMRRDPTITVFLSAQTRWRCYCISSGRIADASRMEDMQSYMYLLILEVSPGYSSSHTTASGGTAARKRWLTDPRSTGGYGRTTARRTRTPCSTRTPYSHRRVL
jgi:hypothetical protein